MQEPLIISSDLSNVSPDPGFILNFENLAGGGTITVGRLFGCKEPQFPTPVFDIQVTVEFGVAQICMYYDDSQLTRGQERNLRFLSTEQIIEGDVNLDGLVDHKDVQQVKQAIKLWNENPDDLNINNNGYGNGWNPLCDINCDKVVDDQDLDIVLFHLGEVSPWIDITTGIDTELNMLYGETDKFSIFRAH